MQLYFAPMEGLTDSIYRRLHHRFFAGVDRYYMPFISPTMHRCLTHKENRELPLADSEDFVAIPQILTKNSGDFLWAAEQCMNRGYPEVNLNLGCPSGTVVAKGKGSGMLADPDSLKLFLDTIFAGTPLPISIKTRVGIQDECEFPGLLEIFKEYPVRELIIHPRVRKDFYKPPVRMASFDQAYEHSHLPLCYNGDICTREDIQRLRQQYPGLNALMIGRGLIANPAMLSQRSADAAHVKAFHDALLEEYTVCFGSARNAMFRMKENWHYLQGSFEGGEKLFKQLRKTTDLPSYRNITAEIFDTLPYRTATAPVWMS